MYLMNNKKASSLLTSLPMSLFLRHVPQSKAPAHVFVITGVDMVIMLGLEVGDGGVG